MDHEGTPVFFKLKKRRDQRLDDDNNLGVVVSTFNMTGRWETLPKVKVWSPMTKAIHTCEESMVQCINQRPFDKNSILILDWHALIKDVDPMTYITESGNTFTVSNMPERAKAARLIEIPMCDWPTNMKETINTWEPVTCKISLNSPHICYKGWVITWTYGSVGSCVPAHDNNMKFDDKLRWSAYVPGAEMQDWQFITERSISGLMEAYKNRYKS